MAVPVITVAAFLEMFPEFEEADEALVLKHIAMAATRTASGIYTAEQQEQAVGLKAATLLLKSPWARKARLVDDTQAFIWAGELYELQRSATMGLRNT
ncbi:MAG: hypothetical protein RLZZ450_66 [Pseudomonadota bacterium]|jgi:hypothetical protein